MTLKKFGIFTSIIVGIIVIVTVVLSCIKVNNGLGLADPDKIVVYAKTSVGLEYSMDTTPSKYKKLNTLKNNMTDLSVMDYMLNGRSLSEKPSQDIDNNYSKWVETNKTNGYCVELIYNEKQSVIVSVDGDTRVIEFYSLIMKVEKSSLGHEVALYFSTTEGTSKNYQTNPILVRAKQNKLLSYIKEVTAE